MPSAYVLAIDVGSSAIKAALVDERGRIRRGRSVPCPARVLEGAKALNLKTKKKHGDGLENGSKKFRKASGLTKECVPAANGCGLN